jgi:hypothetical protein
VCSRLSAVGRDCQLAASIDLGILRKMHGDRLLRLLTVRGRPQEIALQRSSARAFTHDT